MILAVRQNLIASLTILSSVDFIIFSVLIMLQCETELHPFYLFCHCKYISAEVDGGVIPPPRSLSVCHSCWLIMEGAVRGADP